MWRRQFPLSTRIAEAAPDTAREQGVDRTAPLRLTPHLVERPQYRELQRGDAPLLEPRIRYSQTQQFLPEWRRLARQLVIGREAPSEANSAYNFLRSRIIRRLEENGWNTVAVTSPSARSGTTLTAINLAISLARDYAHTALLVELDLVNPAFRRLLGFTQRQGIVDYLLEDTPIADILINPSIDRLTLLPAGSPVINSAEVLASTKMARLVGELRQRYRDRIVLFDLPAVLAQDDAMAFARFVDCALLVVEEGETRVHDLRRAVDLLKPTPILGTVFNRSRQAESAGR